MTAAPFAVLEAAVFLGFGPETTPISQRVAGRYRLSVHHPVDGLSTTSSRVSLSNAQVRVYVRSSTTSVIFNVRRADGAPFGRSSRWTGNRSDYAGQQPDLRARSCRCSVEFRAACGDGLRWHSRVRERKGSGGEGDSSSLAGEWPRLTHLMEYGNVA